MFVKTQAIVFSCLKYRDADLIVKCYTKALGSVSFMAKGVLKSKKGKFRASMFQPLSLIDIEMQYRNKGQLEYFKDLKVSHHLNQIHSQVYKSSIVMFLAEILKSTIVEEEKNEDLYEFLHSSILNLEQSKSFANFHIAFILKLTAYLGFYPHASNNKDEVYFNLSEGLFQKKESLYTLNYEQSVLLSKFIQNSFQENLSIKLSKKERPEILKLIIDYYKLHIANFKSPKTLEVIEQVFN